MPLNVYRTERTRRTQVLACSATDATLSVDDRNLRRLFVLGIHVYHQYGSRRTVTGTVATRHAICKYDTVLLGPYRVAYLYGRLVFGLDGLDGARRADLATTMALWSAVAPLIR